jgi:hypothetical protein
MAAPARADDWVMHCMYPQARLELSLHYFAGVPSYALAVRKPGSSGLPGGKKFPANRIMTPTEMILFSTSDTTEQALVRINSNTLTSRLELGTGASWNYKSLRGWCRHLP